MYDGIYPVTVAGKTPSMFLMFTGVATFSGIVITTTSLIFERRQEEIRRDRVNSLIGLFFNELGNELLELLAAYDVERDAIHNLAVISPDTESKDYMKLRQCSSKIIQGCPVFHTCR